MFFWASNLYWARMAWVVAILVFIGNWALPENISISVFYLFSVFLAINFKEKNDVLLLLLLITTLVTVFSFLQPEEDLLQAIFLKQLPLLAGIWISGLFVLKVIEARHKENNQEQQFEALFRFASSGILLVDAAGKILMANPSVERVFGYEIGELTGKSVELLLPDSARTAHVNHRKAFGEAPRPRSMGSGLDLFGQRKDGSNFPVEVSLSPFMADQQQYVVAFVIDNTFRKDYETSILQQKNELHQLTAALQELNDQLEQKVSARTQELQQAKDDLDLALVKEKELGELKSRFVSMASHEFRTPLSAILSSASLINSYIDRNEFSPIRKHAERIKNAVNGLNTILTEFLSLGRLEEGRIEVEHGPINIPEAIQEVYSELRTLFKIGQHLDYQHTGDENIILDSGLLRNILINIISNAIKYSNENGTIWLKTRVEDHQMTLSIRDEGIGIPTDDQKHLFDRFFRASNATNIHGTGLGLYIVRRYVSMMNGTISFESKPEKGTEFTIIFQR
jgi:PAS domain S-box-containing protein